MATIDNSSNPSYQSPHLVCQAAGSDGLDGTVPGYHIRWDLRKFLGRNHLPKGDLAKSSGSYPTTIGFNRDGDYVKLYKTLLTSHYRTRIDLNSSPTHVLETYNEKLWIYKDVVPSGLPAEKRDVIVSFPDLSVYNSTRINYNPNTSTTNFLKNYSGRVHVSVDGEFAYGVKSSFAAIDSEEPWDIDMRIIVVPDTGNVDDKRLGCFRNLTANEAEYNYCENITYTEFEGNNCYLDGIEIALYKDLILGTNAADEGNGAWTHVGDFSLSMDDTTVYNRLEDSFTIHNTWPKFNEENSTTGEFTVNRENYKDRWYPLDDQVDDPDIRLKKGVEDYLTLSQTDMRAEGTINSPDPNDPSSMDISYLDMIRMVSLDFHLGRMLGLGHIDYQEEASTSDKYIYVAKYFTEVDPEDAVLSFHTTHLYMTLPTTTLDYRLPPKPQLEPIEYGLYAPNGTSEPTLLTDADGYAAFDDVRYIRLKRKQFHQEYTFGQISSFAEPICLCDETTPVFYGIEYKKMGELGFRKPEILQDKLYSDTSGLPEVAPVLESGDYLVYTHGEREEGSHDYSVYSINWFSRASAPSLQASTDATTFDRRTTMLPPSNLKAHLVQKEQTPIMTTLSEQLGWDGINGDKTYVRTQFDWNHQHNSAYQFGNRAELFFGENTDVPVKGQIIGVTDLPDNQVSVTTSSYDLLSLDPIETVQPNILNSAEGDRYAGSIFSAGEKLFEIVEVTSYGDDPTFTLRKIKDTNILDPNNTNTFLTTESWIGPEVGDNFVATKNLNDGANWDNQLTKSVYLESFFTNYKLHIEGHSTIPERDYAVKSVTHSGGSTSIQLHDSFSGTAGGGFISWNRRHEVGGVTSSTITFAGVFSSEIDTSVDLKIIGSLSNEGMYPISSVTDNGAITTITIQGTLADANDFSGFLIYSKKVAITSVDSNTNTVVVTGDFEDEIDLVHQEEYINPDGITSNRVIGGIYKTATVTVVPDVYDEDNVIGGANVGDDIPGSHSGVYTLEIQGYELDDLPDPEVEWSGGIVRIMEDVANFPAPGASNYRAPRMKELEVWKIDTTVSGQLTLTVYDSSASLVTGDPLTDFMPIETVGNVNVNFHPSYKLYLLVDAANNFDEDHLLPEVNEGTRYTSIGIRSVDIFKAKESFVASPVALMGQELQAPEAPGLPEGPLFATRPNFYGKASYTVDVEVNTEDGRRPYAMQFYRGTTTRILEVLYMPVTISSILLQMEALEAAGDQFIQNRWNDLANCNYETQTPNNGLFKDYGTAYRFPLPDNDQYIIPNAYGIEEKPFDGGCPLLDTSVLIETYPGDTELTEVVSIVKGAIQGEFTPLTEAPPLYAHIVSGVQTSGKKASIKNLDGQITMAGADQAPMAVKYVKQNGTTWLTNPSEADFNNAANESFVRFTDFTLDGASVDTFFYYGVEIAKSMDKSEASGLVGPVRLINAFPPIRPVIRSLKPTLEDPENGVSPSVSFEINDYNGSDGIRQIDIYRTSDEIDALTVRTMDKVMSVAVPGLISDQDVIDAFEDVPDVPFGETLYYRIIALREVLNESGQLEMIASMPSKLAEITVADVINPVAPELRSENGTTTSAEMSDVVLKWDKTVHNGTYSLQKRSDNGVWTEFYTVSSNDGTLQYPPLVGGIPDFTNFDVTANLLREDTNGTPTYHRFRVEVENSSGLLNLESNEVVIGLGCDDLNMVKTRLQLKDGHSNQYDITGDLELDEGQDHPISMQFFDIIQSPLPASHNTWGALKVTLEDESGSSVTKSISVPGGSVTFDQNDGLDFVTKHLKYTVTTEFETDNCDDGNVEVQTVQYLSGPCYDISKLTDILSFADGQGTSGVLSSLQVDNGVPYPESLTFTDSIDWTLLGQSLDSIVVKVTDSYGNYSEKEITSEGGSVVFSHGDGNLSLDGSDLNLAYTVDVLVYSGTGECLDGVAYNYLLQYSYLAMVELETITDLLKFEDGEGRIVNPMVSSEFTSGTSYPTSITLEEVVSTNLPIGHIFDRIEIWVRDDNGGEKFFSLNHDQTGNESVVLVDGNGGLGLGDDSPNRTYTISVSLFTNLTGNYPRRQQYTIQYNVAP